MWKFFFRMTLFIYQLINLDAGMYDCD